jgi:GTP-binding protein Era
MTEKKSGIIAFVGAPNAGKSTLTNALLEQKISIVSPKAQTTRNAIKAIIVEGETQLIIIDTPGVFIPRSKKMLERIIVKSAWQAIQEADFVCFLIDADVASKSHTIDSETLRIISEIRKNGFEPAIILNKIDLIKKAKLLEMIKNFSEVGIGEIFMVSAINSDGLPNLKQFLFTKCVSRDWMYDKDSITDAPMHFIASEITREKLFLKLHDELPYSIKVKTDSYEVLENGLIKIHQTIFVLKDSQKHIVIGKNGAMIKQIGIESRVEISNIVDRNVSLYLFVKVVNNWMDKDCK